MRESHLAKLVGFREVLQAKKKAIVEGKASFFELLGGRARKKVGEVGNHSERELRAEDRSQLVAVKEEDAPFFSCNDVGGVWSPSDGAEPDNLIGTDRSKESLLLLRALADVELAGEDDRHRIGPLAFAKENGALLHVLFDRDCRKRSALLVRQSVEGRRPREARGVGLRSSST
jgi:hypothetical protein